MFAMRRISSFVRSRQLRAPPYKSLFGNIRNGRNLADRDVLLRVEAESGRAFSWAPASTLDFSGGANCGYIHPMRRLNISRLESLARLSHRETWRCCRPDVPSRCPWRHSLAYIARARAALTPSLSFTILAIITPGTCYGRNNWSLFPFRQQPLSPNTVALDRCSVHR